MRSTELSQVVIGTGDASPELVRAAAAAIDREEPREIGWATRIRMGLAGLVHPIGIHHWVNYRTYDPAADRIIIWPDAWICSECPKGKVMR
jgi:hypothetical protein